MAAPRLVRVPGPSGVRARAMGGAYERNAGCGNVDHLFLVLDCDFWPVARKNRDRAKSKKWARARGERVERPGRPGRRRAVRARRAARRSRRSRRVRGRPSPPNGASSNHGPARSSPVGKSAHRQLDLRSEARATRPTARPGHRPGPRRIFPPRPRATSTPADPVGTAAAAEPAPTSSRRGLVARASASGDEGGGRGRHALIHVGGVSTRAMGGKDPRTGRGGAQGSQSERRPRRAITMGEGGKNTVVSEFWPVVGAGTAHGCRHTTRPARALSMAAVI